MEPTTSTLEGLQHSNLLRDALPCGESLDLAAGAAWSRPIPREGLTLEISRGSVWITIEGDPEDHIVAAPGTFEVRGRGRLGVQALEPSCVEVERG